MIISHTYRFVFLHIPKCAGKSVRRYIMTADPSAVSYWGWDWDERFQRFVDMAHRPLLDLPDKDLEAVRTYPTCAIVRDPVARFASAVGQHFHQHSYRIRRTADEMLDEITSIKIRHDPAYIHFCPMNAYTHIGDTKLADTVLHLEDPDWKAGLNRFLQEQGAPLPEGEVGHRNRRSSDQGKPEAPEDVTRLAALYARDFELFGYPGPEIPLRTVNLKTEQGWDNAVDFGNLDTVRFLGRRMTRR
nr:sulfotransferase family 2 domain-containing protein [Chachezhania antarctica]